jgi:hypothetical protein
MAKKPETLFKERVLPILRALPRSWWFKVDLISLRGIPDIIGCVNGQFVALELKKDSRSHADPLQGWVMRKILAAGGWAQEVNPESWDQVHKLLVDLALGKIVMRIPEEDVPEAH